MRSRCSVDGGLRWGVLSAALLVSASAGCGSAGSGRVTESPEEVVVVHFGDSTAITDYLPEEQRIDRVLKVLLAAHYPDQRIVSHNVARNGDDIRRFLAPRRYLRGLVTRPSRYQADVVARIPHLDVALIRYGQNDMKRVTPDAFRRDLATLCDRLLHDYPGVHLVLETNTFMDPAHGGRERDNANNDVYWQAIRDLAHERGYPLVDVFARRRQEVAAGNWDFYIRSHRLSQQRFGHLIVDGAKDAEMAGERTWFGNRHPNPNSVRVTADEELRVLRATWPDRLPRAGAG